MNETRAASDAGQGSSGVGLSALTPETYSQLKQIASARLNSFRPGMTLNCTALVHEVFLKLHGDASPFNQQSDENHFLAVASLAMRQILVDHLRARNANKRGGGAIHLTFQESQLADQSPPFDLLELDTALRKLGLRDPGLEKLVVLRFFAGLNAEKTAEVLGRSIRTIERDWARARAYLFQELVGSEP